MSGCRAKVQEIGVGADRQAVQTVRRRRVSAESIGESGQCSPSKRVEVRAFIAPDIVLAQDARGGCAIAVERGGGALFAALPYWPDPYRTGTSRCPPTHLDVP